MLTCMQVANFLTTEYKKKHHENINEQLLHFLLYFAQRESFVKNNKQLFSDDLVIDNDCPINEGVHKIFPYFSSSTPDIKDPSDIQLLDSVLNNYGLKDERTLSAIFKSGVPYQKYMGKVDRLRNQNKININDIQEDVEKIKERIKYMQKLGLKISDTNAQ